MRSGNMAGADSVYVPGREVYFPADSALVMEAETDEVRVGKNFVIASRSGANRFSDGVMYVRGDFTQAGVSNRFVAGNNHRVVLNGSSAQSVQFENADSAFNVLQLSQPLDSYDFSSTPCWNTLIEPELAVMRLPGALTAIEDEAFLGNEELVIVEVQGMNLTHIGSRAFKGCVHLKRITLPGSVQSIAADAFEGCDALTIICEEGSYAQQFADAQNISWRSGQD